jgi:MerR family mercuric resistance operon transcriptional regulator
MNREPAQSQRIGTIAAATGLTPDAIRYYERLGIVPKPARTEGGGPLVSAAKVLKST